MIRGVTPFQPSLAAPEPLRLTANELAAYLADGLDRPLAVTLTRNRVSLMRLKARPDGGLSLRVHAGLLDAPPDTLRALKRYLVTRRRRDWKAVGAFLHAIPRESRPPSPATLRTAGRVYDLQELLDEVNAAFFPGAPAFRIAWGRAASRPRGRFRRHIAYGSYHGDLGLIRIHPLLDDPRVPREFVAFIVFHERLHAALGTETRDGRTCHHTADFRKRERQFPDYPRLRQLARQLVRTLDRPEPRRNWQEAARDWMDATNRPSCRR